MSCLTGAVVGLILPLLVAETGLLLVDSVEMQMVSEQILAKLDRKAFQTS
ncbi:hypothetical protein HZA57_01760 [Candidatus Poribacteria bacterium]|nr:hypothetical protein [Candidatus Poribacteria bacterium]